MNKIFIFAICIILVHGGCAKEKKLNRKVRSQVVVKIPTNEPKGYVDFYNKNPTKHRRAYEIWEDVGGKGIRLTSRWKQFNFPDSYIERFAARPGKHNYQVRYYSVKKTTRTWGLDTIITKDISVEVEVRLGMITPVSIDYIITSEISDREQSFKYVIKVEHRVKYTGHTNKTKKGIPSNDR